MKNICVYCGSKTGNDPIYLEAAKELGKKIAKNNFTLVYGGGDSGLMGAVSSSVRIANGKVIGIMPELLINFETTEEIVKQHGDIIITNSMHERKQMLFEKADAFIALPGGIGTLDELAEMATWSQIGSHQKPIIIANINNFWQPLLELFQHMIDNGFILNYEKFAPKIANNVDEIIEFLI